MTIFWQRSLAWLLIAVLQFTSLPLMEPEAMRSLIDQAQQAWINGDSDQFSQLFISSGEFLVPGYRYRGREEIRAVAADFAQSHQNVAIEIHDILLGTDRAMVEWHWQDEEIASQKHTEADDVIVVDFADGLIRRWREYIDEATPKIQARVNHDRVFESDCESPQIAKNQVGSGDCCS